MPERAEGRKGGRAEGKTATKAKRAVKPKAAAAGAQLRVKQVRSGIGHAATYRRTLEALGLKHHQDEIIVKDNPSIQGMLRKVHHLVRVRPVEA